MPIGKSTTSNVIGNSYRTNPMCEFAQTFLDYDRNLKTSGDGYSLLENASFAMNRESTKQAWKRFFTENFMDTASMGADPLMDRYEIADQKAMMEQLFENDVRGLNEASAMGTINPVMGIVFPMHKNILMNMVFDKGAIQKVVAESPKVTLTMETRILVDANGKEYDMYLEQNKLTDAIDSANPMRYVELTLPESGQTDVVAACGGTARNDLSIKTKISHVKIDNVFIKKGERLPDANGELTSKSEIATVDTPNQTVWFRIDAMFTPGYNGFERSLMQPVNITIHTSATADVTKSFVLTGSMEKNKFNIFTNNNECSAVRLATCLDSSTAMLQTAHVKWSAKTTYIEIPEAVPLNTTISPEEVKDVAALYQVNQLSKIMSLYKAALGNYKDDHIKLFLDDSYETLDSRSKIYDVFDFAAPEGYALDHVEHRRKTFFEFIDDNVTDMLYVLNDPNMVISIFGDPSIIRKVTPVEYTYSTPDAIGPVELDYTRTVCTSDKRVYQFIGSDKMRNTNQLIVLLCPRNSDRVTYRIFDYQMYVSNEIRNSDNTTLPAIHAFERWLIKDYQPVQCRIDILNKKGFRPQA